MPEAVEFTPEEQTKVDAYLKTLGFEADKPTELVKKLNDEAKTHRESFESTKKTLEEREKELDTFRKAEKTRVDEQKKKDDEAAAAQKKLDDEKKTFDQKLSELDQKIDLARKEDKAKYDKEREALMKKIEARDEKAVMMTARAVGRAAGLIDLDFIKLLDLKGIKVDDGEVDVEAIEKLFEKHKEDKPHLYGGESKTEDRTDKTPVLRPAPDRQHLTVKGPDFSKLDDDKFEAEEARLRSFRG